MKCLPHDSLVSLFFRSIYSLICLYFAAACNVAATFAWLLFCSVWGALVGVSFIGCSGCWCSIVMPCLGLLLLSYGLVVAVSLCLLVRLLYAQTV